MRPVFCKECLAQAREEKRSEIEARKNAKKKELAILKTEEMPLNQAMRKKPVDFSGKEITENRKQKTESSPLRSALPGRGKQQKVAVRKNNGEGELREGEEVKF